MRTQDTPAMLQRPATVRLAVAAQLLSAIAGALVVFHVATGVLVPLTSWELPPDAQARLLLAWAGVNDYEGSGLPSGPLWTVGVFALVPYCLLLLAALQLWSFFRSTRHNVVPPQQVTSFLTRFGVLVAGVAIAFISFPTLAWLVAIQGTTFAQGPLPIRVTAEQLLLLLSAFVPIAVAGILRDASIASADARGIV